MVTRRSAVPEQIQPGTHLPENDDPGPSRQPPACSARFTAPRCRRSSSRHRRRPSHNGTPGAPRCSLRATGQERAQTQATRPPAATCKRTLPARRLLQAVVGFARVSAFDRLLPGRRFIPERLGELHHRQVRFPRPERLPGVEGHQRDGLPGQRPGR